MFPKKSSRVLWITGVILLIMSCSHIDIPSYQKDTDRIPNDIRLHLTYLKNTPQKFVHTLRKDTLIFSCTGWVDSLYISSIEYTKDYSDYESRAEQVLDPFTYITEGPDLKPRELMKLKWEGVNSSGHTISTFDFRALGEHQNDLYIQDYFRIRYGTESRRSIDSIKGNIPFSIPLEYEEWKEAFYRPIAETYDGYGSLIPSSLPRIYFVKDLYIVGIQMEGDSGLYVWRPY